MPGIKLNRPVEEVNLPSGAVVKMESGALIAGDLINLQGAEKEAEALFGILASRIREWNYTNDETGETLPINAEMVRYLPAEDIGKLSESLGIQEGLSDAEKKASSAASPVAEGATKIEVDFPPTL